MLKPCFVSDSFWCWLVAENRVGNVGAAEGAASGERGARQQHSQRAAGFFQANASLNHGQGVACPGGMRGSHAVLVNGFALAMVPAGETV